MDTVFGDFNGSIEEFAPEFSKRPKGETCEEDISTEENKENVPPPQNHGASSSKRRGKAKAQ